MNKKQIKEYIKNLNFGLKNINKTTDKYKDYKNIKFKSLINKEAIKEHFLFLNQMIKEKYKNNYLYIEDLDFNSKSNIKTLKRCINNITLNLNLKFIKELVSFELNKNEIKNFNIKFYLKYYNQINKIMKEVLKEIVLNKCRF